MKNGQLIMENEKSKEKAMKTENIVRKKSFDFALSIVHLSQKLRKNREFILSKQLLRSGTSIGANIEEADVAQSKKDFIAKMSIALKEARETRYWLRLLDTSKIIEIDFSVFLQTAEELERILTAILKTSRNG